MENNRVTKIIGSVFPFNTDCIPDSVLENSINFGNAVHKMCYLYLKGTLNEKTLDQQLLPYLNQFKKWLEDTQFKVMGFEQRIVSKRYNFSGTPDIWGKYHGRLSVVDIKTTAVIAKTIGLQLSGYEMLIKEYIGKSILYFDRYVLRLFSNKQEFIPVKRKSDMRAFLSCLCLHNYKKEVGIE